MRERRDVTALVATSPEARFLTDPLVERLLRRFGGVQTEDAPLPDGSPAVIALFGVRDPDGRDTEAAARCALRLARSARTGTQTGMVDVPLRIGIACGRMLVDMAGDAVRDESYDKLTTAARELAERAAPGQVVASREGHRAIAGLFKTTRLGESGPCVVQEERSLADASGKFVGRREELRRVGELLAAANRGKMKMIGLSGEAGSGKTRLLLETLRRLTLGGHDVGMYVATCPRQSRRIPLAAITEMLRAMLGIDEFEAEADMREKVSRLRELGLGPAEIAAVSVTLGLGPGPDESVGNAEQTLRQALARTALKLAQDRLTVFAWDAAESMDDESQALVDGLIRDAREARVRSFSPTGPASYTRGRICPSTSSSRSVR